jgi:hypothetical protein
LLDALAESTERALARAGERLAGGTHAEWLGTEPDFRVLAALARYHARKMVAAEAVAEFELTHSRAAIERARSEIEQSAAIWERLVKETDGLYPPAMAYGPADTGHWKDKLAIVQADREVVERLRAAGPLRDQPELPGRTPRTAAPEVQHTPPVTALAGRPLRLVVKLKPAGRARTVRLHYRLLNAQEKFRTLEAPAGEASFTIPAAEVSPRWDLLYYFELLDERGGGWFHPDPFERTPYFVVAAENPPAQKAGSVVR